MRTSTESAATLNTATRIANCSVVSLLAVIGMLLMPVSCTCGSQVPHGHSLFQLPHHHHGSDHLNQDSRSPDHQSLGKLQHPVIDREMSGLAGAVLATDVECAELDRLMHGFHFAMDNLLEQGDGASLKAPTSSSIGHPMAFSEPSTIVLQAQCCGGLTLPRVRDMHGTSTLPETPPPQFLA